MPVLTKADAYEHGRLVVRFTCPCGKEHAANFTKRESVQCACGRMHYPIVNVVTHQHAKERP